jgi:hypothetical protein
MSARARTTRVALGVALAMALILVSATPAAAKLGHKREGGFTVGGFSWVGVDNSGGPSAGDVYLGEDKFEFAAGGFVPGTVRQLEANGTPTGVELNGAETPAGSFGFTSSPGLEAKLADGVAVSDASGPASGDVYVADLAHGVVDRFDESGSYVCQITGAAVPSASECAGATGSQTPTGGVSPLSVAVDPANGKIAVGDASGVIYEFNEAGEYVGEIADLHLTEPGSLAFDSTGVLYVSNANGSPLSSGGEGLKFGPTGTFESVVTTTPGVSVGVDQGTDHVYFGSKSGEIEEFDASGGLLSTFGSGGQVSIDANASNGRVYVTAPAIFGGEAQIWSGDIFFPSVTTGPATAVAETSATLSGHVDPETGAGGSPIATCEFEYGTTTAYGSLATCSPATPYSAPTDVSAALAGLTPGTTYHYRLSATNAEATGEGEDRTFTTAGTPVITEEVAIARTESATLSARINPFGSTTTCAAEYVDAATFEATGFAQALQAPCSEALGAGFEPQTAHASAAGLKIGTTYHFRFRATNASGTSFGEDQTFSTFGIESFTFETVGQNGEPFTQAGGHPYEMRINFALTTTAPVGERHSESASANLKTVRVELPPGLIGNPAAVPKCPPFEVALFRCPGADQVGRLNVRSTSGENNNSGIYNLVPQEGIAAQLGGRFNDFATVRVDAGIRTGSDYGVTGSSLFVTADEAVKSVSVSLWGVPAAAGHDGERECPGPEPLTTVLCASSSPTTPFLTNPTSCTGPLTTTLSVDAWQDPGNYVSTTAPMPAMTGCDRLDFKPAILVQPQVHTSDSATGLDVDLHVPQNQDPVGLAEANLKDATVRLPAGLSIDPAGADGLAACSPAQIALHGPDPASCPAAAKIGDVEVDTPLLDHPLRGSVFVATPHDNPFHSLLAIYVAIDDPQSGIVVKLAGHVEPDPGTGQLTTTFSENPQLPFEDFKLSFFGGSQAVLSTPTTCATYTTTSRLTPWTTPAGADASPSDSFPIDNAPGGGRCPVTEAELPTVAGFDAGTVTPLAATYSPFVMHLARADGSQRLSAIDLTLPPGLLGRLAGAPYCPPAAIQQAAQRHGPDGGALELADPSCPPGSELGRVVVGVGAGAKPLAVQGKVYLAGPYKGAPLSLVIVTPAVAGPFDLGVVVVRAALFVDQQTAQVGAVSDPLPTILEGIPLDVRTIALELNRPNFTLNPTSCEALTVSGKAISTNGGATPLSSHFQVGGCRGLRFKPKLSIHLAGPTKRGKFPRLRATVQAKPGEADISRASVALPHSEFLEQGHIGTVCTRVQYAEGQVPGEKCPPASIYGHAKAITPLLDQPLEGPVVLRSSSHKLPDLVAALHGQIDISLDGVIDSKNGGLRTRFEAVPDAPVTKFVLTMKGGKKSLLVNSENLCAPRAKTSAIANFIGHNGKVAKFKATVANECEKKAKKKIRARP